MENYYIITNEDAQTSVEDGTPNAGPVSGLLFELLVVERRTTEIELKSLEQWPTTKDEGVRARRVRQTEP